MLATPGTRDATDVDASSNMLDSTIAAFRRAGGRHHHEQTASVSASSSSLSPTLLVSTVIVARRDVPSKLPRTKIAICVDGVRVM
jgi:hypothetical protein